MDVNMDVNMDINMDVNMDVNSDDNMEDIMELLDPSDYTVVWFAPLPAEARAAYAALDTVHEGIFPKDVGHASVIKAGTMCGHNIIIASPTVGTVYGNSTAAAIASQMKHVFKNLEFGLLVGVAAGLPNLSLSRDIRLGDILVALHEKQAVVAYGLGKETGKDTLELVRDGHAVNPTAPAIDGPLSQLFYEMDSASATTKLIMPYYNKIKKKRDGRYFEDPG